MRKIIVMNAKGGCGKTTLATNLASLYSAHGFKTALLDYDPQGSSCAWLRRRSKEAAPIYGVAAHQQTGWSATRSWQLRVPLETERVIIDTPAAIKSYDVASYLKDVDTVIIPVLSSVIDVEASALFIHEALKVTKVRSSKTRVVVVASRVRARSPALQVMVDLFSDMGIPIVGHLRDSINYLQCTDLGLGVHDLPTGRAQFERRSVADLVTSIDVEFAERLCVKNIRQRVSVPQREVALSVPQAAMGRYNLSWENS